jgi:TorA maturation chaperone TorD
VSTSPSLAERADLVRALGAYAERPTDAMGSVASAIGIDVPSAADYTDLFVHQLVPYASVYLGPEGGIGGTARDTIAGFWRAVGLTPPAEPDHLSSLLGLWASLAERPGDDAGGALRDHAVGALVWEHLVPWLPPYLARVAEVGARPYAAWADILGSLVGATSASTGLTRLPHHLAVDPAPPTAADDVVPYVLAPARSGLVLTRSDIARAAAESGLGMRIGERAYALSAMIDQDADAVFRWMADEASRQAEGLAGAVGPEVVLDRWQARLATTRAFLVEGYGGGR